MKTTDRRSSLSHFSQIRTLFIVGWQWLTEPTSSIQDLESRRRARLLSALLLTLIILSAIGALGRIDGNVTPEVTFLVVALIVAYGLSRSRHYLLAAWIASCAFFAPPLAAITNETDFSQTSVAIDLIWIALPILLGHQILPAWQTTLLAILGILIMPFLFVFVPELTIQAMIFPLAFVSSFSALVVIASWIRYQDLRQITREAARRKRAETDLAHQAEVMATLYKTSLEINAQPDLSTLLEAIVRRAANLVETQAGAIYLMNEDGQSITLEVTHNLPGSYLGTTLKLGEGLSGQIAEQKSYYAVDDYKTWPGRATVYQELPFRRMLGVPLIMGDNLIGVINVVDLEKAGSFTEDEIQSVRLFADQAAIAIKNSQLLETAQQELRERERAERELQAYRDQLEELVKQRTTELRESEEKLRSTLASMDDFVFVFNEAGIFQSIYQPGSMEELILPQEAYLGKPYQEVFPEDVVDLIDTAVNAIIADGEVQQFDYPIAINGQEYWFSARISPRRDNTGQFAGVTTVARDITKRKQMEKSLAKRTEELEAANEELKIFSQMKDEFVSSVSHELRTPITNLKLYHSLLLLNTNKTEKYMSVLQRETERLEDIVEGLLSLSRLDQGQVRLNLESVDLNVLARQYSADRKALANNKGLKLRLICEPQLPTVTADKSLLGQALSILLTNAFNYTLEGGEVIIHTQTRNRDECLWVGFSVTDSGLGIPIEEQPHLFERFYRGKGALEGGTPGTGLGLAIAKEIVNQHQGLIEASSDGIPGHGATFSIWLPVKNSFQTTAS